MDIRRRNDSMLQGQQMAAIGGSERVPGKKSSSVPLSNGIDGANVHGKKGRNVINRTFTVVGTVCCAEST